MEVDYQADSIYRIQSMIYVHTSWSKFNPNFVLDLVWTKRPLIGMHLTFVFSARPQYAAQTFALLTTFPSKELTDSEQTIEKAGLANAAIMQRLK